MADGPVLCFGEILFDELPSGERPGGAPFNVAWHLARAGHRAILLSSIGDDAEGARLSALARAAGVDTTYVGVRRGFRTGRVTVRIEADQPCYTIHEGVAWDRVDLPSGVAAVARDAAAVVFGTLAARSDVNRTHLARLLASAPGALRIFDVNLRPPWVDRSWALANARGVDLLKLNLDEAALLLDDHDGDRNQERLARRIADLSGAKRVCLTAGARGAGLLVAARWHEVAARRVAVVDSVGAGDALLSQLVRGLLLPSVATDEVLARAARLAEFVVTREGATPAYELGDDGWPRLDADPEGGPR